MLRLDKPLRELFSTLIILLTLHQPPQTKYLTELKIYAAENETEDGKRASQYYGVDHVDWRNALRTLKEEYGFTATQLNAYDGWHPNILSGFVCGLMMYMELFGEQPNFETVKALAEQTVWSYLLGTDDMEKEACLSDIYTLAASYVLTNK